MTALLILGGLAAVIGVALAGVAIWLAWVKHDAIPALIVSFYSLSAAFVSVLTVLARRIMA